MDQIYKEKVISTYYSYKENIIRVWDVIKRIDKTVDIFSNYYSNFILLKGENTFQQGNEFHIIWKDSVNLRGKVEEVKEKSSQKEIVFLMVGEKFDVEYKLYHILKFNSIDKETVFIYKMKIIKGNFTKKQMENLQYEFMDMCRSLDNYLFNNIDHKNNVESIIIKKKRYFVWKIVSDWILLKEYVPEIAESVTYEGDTFRVGSKITLKWGSKNVENVFIVKKIENSQENSFWELFLESTISTSKTPSQELKILLLKINDKGTFIYFKHIFKEPIEKEYLEELKEYKKNILKTLKKNLEINRNSI